MSPIDKFLRRCDVAEGRTLIVGSKIHEGTEKQDRRKLYSDAIGIDMELGPGVDFVRNLENFPAHEFGRFAHIECTSVLEHSRRPWLLCETLERLLSDDGGTIVVAVPWIWRIHNYPGDFWRFTPMGIESMFTEVAWERQSYIVEGKLVKTVPKMRTGGKRWHARSELIMFGRKCASIS